MDYPHNLTASDRYWLDLILKCRTSGKSDRQWLAENSIVSPTFYYHIKQLRKKSCEIPGSSSGGSAEIHEVVPLIIEDTAPSPCHVQERISENAETTVRLNIRGVTIEITNEASQPAIRNTVAALYSLC